MKKQKKGTAPKWLIALALLAFSFSTTDSILAQTEPESIPLAEITPENIGDLELLHWFGQGAFSGQIAQPADGQTLAAITTSGVALFNGEDGKQVGFIPIGLEPTALSISPDGSTLAIVVNYPTGDLGGFMGLPVYNRQIQLYSLPDGEKKGKAIQDLGECADSNIWDIAFTPDGTQLIFEKKHGGDDDRIFCRISLTTGKLTGTLKLDQPTGMAISPSGETVAVIAEQSNKVAIYDSKNFELIHDYEFSFPSTNWPQLLFSPSGRAVAVRTLTDDDPESYTLQVWDIANGETIYSGIPALAFDQEYDQYDMITCFEVSQDLRTIYLGTQFGQVAILDVGSGKLEKQIGTFTWTANSLTGNPGGETSHETSAMVKIILLSSDEKTLIASEDLTTYGQSGSIHIFQIPAGKEVFSFQGSAAGSESLGIAFSPDSSQIALAGAKDGKVEIYHSGDGQVDMELEGHTQTVNQVAFSPDGKMIATGSDDNTIRLWDAQTGRPIRTLSGHQGRVTRIAFSPDSTWLISGADDNTIRRWNAADGKTLETLNLGDENWRVDFLDILNDNTSVVYRISKYPSPFIGFLQEQILWNTQSGESKTIGGSNTSITQFDSGKELFSGYSNSGRVVGKLQDNGSMAITASFNSPYGNGALSLPAIAPNQQLVVSGNGFGLHAWDISGKEINFLGLVGTNQPIPSYGNEYLFSPDGKYLAYTSGGVAYLMGIPSK